MRGRPQPEADLGWRRALVYLHLGACWFRGGRGRPCWEVSPWLLGEARLLIWGACRCV